MKDEALIKAEAERDSYKNLYEEYHAKWKAQLHKKRRARKQRNLLWVLVAVQTIVLTAAAGLFYR